LKTVVEKLIRERFLLYVYCIASAFACVSTLRRCL